MEIIESADKVVFLKQSGIELVVIITCHGNELVNQILFNPTWKLQKNGFALSLDDIHQQVVSGYKADLITVIAEYPLRGTIYRYGNYTGNDWVKIGTIFGYA